MRIGLYPGTFDPLTNGHLDVMTRAGRIFDRVIVAVAPNPQKSPLFTLDERLELIRPNLPADGRFEVVPFQGLLVNFAREMGAIALIRGLRAVSDFEFEFQMAHMNRDLADDIETVFFMPSQDYFFTSSNLMKQVARYTDPHRLRRFLPANVADALSERFGRRSPNAPA